jgi:hypothetical protein
MKVRGHTNVTLMTTLTISCYALIRIADVLALQHQP